MRFKNKEKGEFNPVATPLLFFCSQVYNTFLQRQLIDIFQREQVNKETSHLYREVGDKVFNIKTPSKGLGDIYKEDLDNRVM